MDLNVKKTVEYMNENAEIIELKKGTQFSNGNITKGK